MNIHRSETAMLRERIAQLEEELRQLRETFAGSQDSDLRELLATKYRLTPTEITVFRLLLRSRFVTIDQMYAATYGGAADVQEDVFKVRISHIRKKTGVHVACVYKHGYWIPNREQVLAALLEGKELPQ